jgi:integrase/recombinase XerD
MAFCCLLTGICLQIVCKFLRESICEIEKLSVMSITINIILDTRRIKKSEKYPIKLRVTHDRNSEYYQTIFDLTKNDYDKLSASRISNELQTIRDKLKFIETTAQTAVRVLSPFTFKEFEIDFTYDNKLFRQKKIKLLPVPEIKTEFDFTVFHKKFYILLEDYSTTGTVFYSYLKYIKSILQEGRIGTAMYYHCSYISLNKFRGNVRFTEVTASFLYEYENWLKAKNVSKTTIGMYIRPLRTIFNEAIEDGFIKKEKCYPFGRRKYRIPASKNTKKALELADLKKIYYYQCDPDKDSEQKAKDFWLFSYFGNGMNPKDIACLKYKNIHDDYLVFERSKTERALTNDPKPITVFINDDMKKIMERWGNKDKASNNFIFPILEIGITPLRQYEILQLFVHFINDWMKNILKNLGINKKATTYVARHTFSTVLKRSGASTEYIQEALGHSDIKTTENYLDSFENDMKREYANRLTSFKDENTP